MKFSEYMEKYADDARIKNWKEQYDFDLCFLVDEARLYAGLTQAQLARKMGTQQPSVARVEGGSVVPGHDFLKRMADAVGAKLVAPKFDFMVEREKAREQEEMREEIASRASASDTIHRSARQIVSRVLVLQDTVSNTQYIIT